jgi:tetratricopeptide (TPR) repeat protein
MKNGTPFPMFWRNGILAKFSLRSAAAQLGACLLLAASASGQGPVLSRLPDPTTAGSNVQTYSTQGAVVVLTVLSGARTRLDRQAVVKLRNQNTQEVVWQTTTDAAEASFGDLLVGSYDVEVSAVGYLTAHKTINVQGAFNTYHQEITVERDPTSIELAAPTASAMPKKARNETLRGISALKSGNYSEAQKRLDAAYKMVPANADLNFLVGYLSIQQKRLDLAQNYLSRATVLDPHNVRALILLGRLYLQREEYGAARTTLEQAVVAGPQDWMAHNLLAEICLHQREYEPALKQAQLAIDIGKAEASPAQLILGQALAHLGRMQEAIQPLHSFLQENPTSPMIAQVRGLIAEIEQRLAAPAQSAESSEGISTLTSANAPLDAAESELPLEGWQPPGIDDSKPLVAAGVNCPAAMVIDKAGGRVQQLADDVSRFAAIEDLVHERLNPAGVPLSRETRKFNYVVSISKPSPGFLEVDEFRSERSGLDDFPDKIASQGFPALAMVFHPDMRDNFQMTCEGLGDWRGQATWLVHFGQRDDRPNRIHSYRLGGQSYPVGLKGRAWITADKFQIVRMESEMIAPMPKIQLLTEHQIVEYGPILFEKKNEQLWLPKSAEFYFEFRRRRYFRRHSFDHFMLFSVDADEKRNESNIGSRIGSQGSGVEPLPNQ